MIISLNGSTESLTMVLSGAKTTVDVPSFVTWLGDGGPKTELTNTNGVTAVVPVTGVDGAQPKRIETIVVNNIDTGAITLTISKKVGSTSSSLFGPLTLQVGDTLTVNTNGELKVTDTNGQTKSSASANALNLTVGATTAAAGTTTADAGLLPSGAGIYPTTAADGTKGVRIAAGDKVTGRTIIIGNGVSNQILKVYGPSGATINGAAADAAFSSASGKGVVITCLNSAANTWLAE